MTATAIVTVILAGEMLTGSQPAMLERGTVVAPINPFARAIARAGERREAGVITFARDDRRVIVRIGRTAAFVDGRVEQLPIAPYLRDGRVIIPLGAIARALGITVDYDSARHVLLLSSPAPTPVVTMTPYAAAPAVSSPLATFTPRPVPTAQPTVTGVPQPRRTPIEAGW